MASMSSSSSSRRPLASPSHSDRQHHHHREPNSNRRYHSQRQFSHTNKSGENARVFLMEAQQPWSRSRSAGDLSRIFLNNADNGNSSSRGSNSKTEFYRISRRRIVGCAIQEAERELMEVGSNETRSNETRSNESRSKRTRKKSSANSHSDEGVGDLSHDSSGGGGGESGSQGRMTGGRRSQHAALTRHRSLETGMAPTIESYRADVLSFRQSIIREAQRCLEELSQSEEDLLSNPRPPIAKQPVQKPARRGIKASQSNRGNMRGSRSQGNLVDIQEEEQFVHDENVGNRRMMSGEKRVESPSQLHRTDSQRKVTETRLLKIASFHHLPRVSNVRKTPSSKKQEPEERDPAPEPAIVSPAPGDLFRRRKKSNVTSEKKRARNKTIAVSSRQLFLPPSTAAATEATLAAAAQKLNEAASNDALMSAEPSSSSGNGSDPGICLNYGSSDEASEADSLELDTKLFANKSGSSKSSNEKKSCSSTDSSIAHSYIASRGQREREEEIYEVLPPTIKVKPKVKVRHQQQPKVVVKKMTFFGNSEC